MYFHRFLCALGLFMAATQAGAQPAPFVFAINEGVTYQASPLASAERFKELNEDLTKLLKRPVTIKMVGDYRDLDAGLTARRYDLAYVHPAHHSIRAMAKSGYKLVAVTKGLTEYQASFLVRGDSTLKTMAELKTARLGAPAEDSITSVLMRATLRDVAGATLPQITYVKLQEAVPFMVEHGMAGAGVSASRAVVKDWQSKGGKVLGTSKPVPIKHLIASSNVTDAERAEIASYFLGLEQTPEGKKRLGALNVQGFVEYNQATLLGMAAWLGV